MTLGGYAQGIVVETHEGRPTKIDGNPDHPANLGSSDPFMQASVLSLYDPDRSKNVMRNGESSTWDVFLKEVQKQKLDWLKTQGDGVVLLTEVITSPTLIQQISNFLKRFPKAKWHQFNPLDRENIYQGTALAFGERLNPIYHVEEAKVIVSLDGPFLDEGPGRLLYARKFADARRVRAESRSMNRLYVAEGTPSLTGAMADHRLSMKPSWIEKLARAMAQQIGVPGIIGQEPFLEKSNWTQTVVRDLNENSGKGLVVCGDRQSPALHALCFAMNSRLGNIDKTVSFTVPVESEAGRIHNLVDQMNSGKVDTLFILGGNPAYIVPADLNFQGALAKVRNRIRLSEYKDETAILCQWELPEAHFLETWGDARAFDGTASVQQPVCAPFYEGKSALELLSLLSDSPGKSSYELIREFWRESWKEELKSDSFESKWERVLHDGVIPETRAKNVHPKVRRLSLLAPRVSTSLVPSNGMEVIFKEDPSVYDGMFSNNGWLQELPRPTSKLVWTNAALIGPETANSRALTNDDEVEIHYQGRSVCGAVFILPGQAENVVTVHLGYGRTQAGRVGNDHGFNGYSIQTSVAPYDGTEVGLRKTGKNDTLVTTQHHFSMEGRNLVREGTIAQFIEDPRVIAPAKLKQEGVAPDYVYSGAAWGMSIDVNTCIGCNTCMIACQAENNIPIVGKEEVLRGRSMHWIRVDRYYQGSPETPQTVFQPVPCMHCETAPCEEVCPTAATNHSSEGLNQMIYNRCVGTRFCSNNCPYKVRRFNFFQYSDMKSSLAKMMKNPDVTVRSRGVMEKCTYCVQRIREAQIHAQLENREVKDGEIVTACQASCPTQAIVFGDLNDPTSAVSKLKKEPLDYLLLEELGTKPRTTYLAKLRNPNSAFGRGGE